MRRGWRWAFLAVVVVLLVLFARGVEWTRTWRAIRDASLPLLAAATAVNLLSLGIKGVRWWLFLRARGVPSLGVALRASVAGAGLNNVLVAQGGEAARVLLVSHAARASRQDVLATMALDRLFDPVCFVLLLASAGFLLDLPPDLARLRWIAAAAIALAFTVLVVLVRVTPRDEAIPLAPGARMLVRWRRRAASFARDVARLSTLPRVALALLLSIAVWALQIAVFNIVARAAGTPMPLAGHVAALLGTNLGLLARATPGNVGVFQVVYALVASGFGVPGAAAVATALLIQAVQIVPVTVLGLLLAHGLTRPGAAMEDA